VLESLTPLTLEVALQVQRELENRFNEADKLRQQQVGRAQYEAKLARRRFMQVIKRCNMETSSRPSGILEKLQILSNDNTFAKTPNTIKEVTMPKEKAKRDIEKGYSTKQMVPKLRRLADCLEQGKRFQIQIAGERILFM
jgi:hypothetical protein